MKSPSATVVIACCCLFAACGDSRPATPPIPRFDLAAGIAPAATTAQQIETLRTSLTTGARPTVVVAHDDALAAALFAAHLEVQLVAVTDTAPALAGPLRYDAVVVPETGADVAVDAALLFCNGIPMPNRVLPIGARWFTISNLAAGGAAMPASGDPILALLRMQYAAALTTDPTATVVHRIGFLQFRDSPWHTRVREAVQAAAKTHAQLELKTANAIGDVAAQDRMLRDLMQDGCRALVVSTDDPQTLADIAKVAVERSVDLIVLDPQLREVGACCIGCDPDAIGRAAGEAIRQLVPSGARVVELLDALPPPLLAQRHQGLAAVLGSR